MATGASESLLQDGCPSLSENSYDLPEGVAYSRQETRVQDSKIILVSFRPLLAPGILGQNRGENRDPQAGEALSAGFLWGSGALLVAFR